MNFASVRRPIVPPTPPRAPDDMSFLGRVAVIRHNMIASWGQRAYEDDVIKGRFFRKNSFILNKPDSIRHILLTNYQNYTRTPAGIRSRHTTVPGARRSAASLRTGGRRSPLDNPWSGCRAKNSRR